MQHSRRRLAWITLTLAGCSGQGTDNLSDELDGSRGHLQNDAAIVDATVARPDPMLDASTSMPDAETAMDAATDSAAMANGDSGPDTGAGDAATADAGDVDGPCGAKFTCEDIVFSASKWENYQFVLQFPNGFPFESGTVSGMVDSDLGCGEPASFSATLNFDSESDHLSFTAPGLCPFRACNGGLTLTVTDSCDRTYEIPITQLTVDSCEGSDLVLQTSCGGS